jgi:hypothetical protein
LIALRGLESSRKVKAVIAVMFSERGRKVKGGKRSRKICGGHGPCETKTQVEGSDPKTTDRETQPIGV